MRRTGLRRGEWLVAGVVVVATVAAMLWWLMQSAHYPTDDATRRFAIETVVVAIAALVAALLAAIFAWPVFRDYLAEQQPSVVTIGVQAFDLNDDMFEPIANEPCDIYQPPQPQMKLQVVVHVNGTTVRDAVMNILVLAKPGMEIVVLDTAAAHGHYLVPLPGMDDRIVPGQASPVRFSRVERNFPPGNFHVYGVLLGVHTAGDWPVRIVLDGTPHVHAEKDVVIRRLA